MIYVELDQHRLKGGQLLPLKVLKRVLYQVSKEVRVKEKITISVAFVSSAVIRQLNKKYRGNNAITDVLSFPLGGKGEDPFGELIISYDQAQKQAKKMRHSTRDEVVFLMVHGLLHLFGFDHIKTSEAKHMFSVQTKILKKLNVDPQI